MKTKLTVSKLIQQKIQMFAQIPYSLIAFIARFSMAAVFWKSGQTKVENFAVDIVDGTFELGMPKLAESAVGLFAEEYKLPLINPELGATLAALGEHILPVLLLVGLASRLSAFGLLIMTLVIQLFVYPSAYPTHGTWIAILLVIIAMGPGKISIDHWLSNINRNQKNV